MKQHAYINGSRRKDLEKLTPAMWRMIGDLRYSGNPRQSLSPAQTGAAGTILRALRKRGLVAGASLTQSGRDAIDLVQWRDA